MTLRTKKYIFFIFTGLAVLALLAQRPIPPNTFYDLHFEQEMQFHPRHFQIGFGTGRFHSDMEAGPVIIFRNTAYCAAGNKNPVVQSKVLLRTRDFMGFYSTPVTFHSHSFKRPREQVTLLTPLLQDLLEEHGDYLFFARVKTDVVPVYDPNPFNPLGYIERPLTEAQDLLLCGYFTSERKEPFHLGWVNYHHIEELDISIIPRLIDFPFSLFQFSMPDFYIYELEARIYPVEEYVDFPFFNTFDLFNLRVFEEEMFFDLRYATDNNFTGTRVYPYPFAYLQKEAALALKRVNDTLREKGYALVVLDAYRPLTVQYLFWDVLSDPKYVANPITGSRHNRGVSVDVTLATLDGVPVEMPSDYDEFTERAHVNFQDASEEALKNRQLLISTMKQEGFNVLSTEWWHFDFSDFTAYPVTDFIPDREEMKKRLSPPVSSYPELQPDAMY